MRCHFLSAKELLGKFYWISEKLQRTEFTGEKSVLNKINKRTSRLNEESFYYVYNKKTLFL